jgi:acetylglutamate kinase
MARTIDLRKAVPYLRMYKGATFVIKAGGAVLAGARVLDALAEQAGLLHQLGIDVVLVHGGGAQATELSERLGIPVEKVNGRRITSAETLDVAKMIFNGKLNTDLLSALAHHRVQAVGLSGVDGELIRARRRPLASVTDESGEARLVDFGYVGDVVSVDPSVILHLLEGGFMPVVSSMAGGEGGEVYNVNADTVAARLAVALGAQKLVIVTGVPGVLADASDPSSLISVLGRSRAGDMIGDGAAGGMHAKLEACCNAIDAGVPRAHVIDGRDPDALLVEIFTNEGSGTLIERDPAGDEAACGGTLAEWG